MKAILKNLIQNFIHQGRFTETIPIHPVDANFLNSMID
jgi:hypothetical protein